MATICKIEEWQAASGVYYTCDKGHLGTVANQWWFPARILGLSIPEFVELLHDKYKAEFSLLENDQLLYYWDKKNYSACHSFVLYVNKIARNKNIKV